MSIPSWLNFDSKKFLSGSEFMTLFFTGIHLQEITVELLRDAMRQHKECAGFLIDGFPREHQQGIQFEQEVSVAL